jgi:hypothetical protein
MIEVSPKTSIIVPTLGRASLYPLLEIFSNKFSNRIQTEFTILEIPKNSHSDGRIGNLRTAVQILITSPNNPKIYVN